MDRRTVHLRLDGATFAQLDQLCQRYGQSQAAAMRQAIRRWYLAELGSSSSVAPSSPTGAAFLAQQAALAGAPRPGD